MLKRILCTIVTVFMVASCVSYADLVTLGNNLDVWKDTFVTEQNRLYPNTTVYSSRWPSYDGSSLATNIETVITDEKAKSVGDVFGEESYDLQFADINSVESFESYIVDDMSMSNISFGDMKEWNGFLFVIVCGYKTEYSETSYTDYNGNTKSYTVATRPTVSYGKMESYLYIFDISKAENYGKARYARWTEEDLGFGELKTQIMEKVDVDDSYIYLTLSNGSYTSAQGNTAYNKCRGLAVFENNIKRGETAVVPKRVENNYTQLPYGVKNIMQNANNQSTLSYIYKSTVIDGKHILWYSGKTSLQSSTKLNESMMIVSDAFGEGAGTVYYTTSTYGNSLGDLLACPGGDWSNMTSPMIKAVVNDGNNFYFLVTYTNDANYTVIYKTDWSKPENPTLISTYKYSFNGSDITKDTRLFKYGNKIYVSHDLGIDVINDSYVGTILYSSDIFSVKPTSPVRLVTVGDYMYIWYNVGATAYDVKVCFDETGLGAESFSTGAVARQKPFGDVIIHGTHIYMPAFMQSPAAYRQNIARVDISKLIPVSLEVESLRSEVTAPYTIKGTGTNIDYVYVNDNGIISEIRTTCSEDGLMHWNYPVDDAGEHNIKFTGAFVKNSPIEETSEYITLNLVYTEAGVLYSADETTITAQITLSGAESTDGTAVVAVYSNNELTDVKTCNIVNGETVSLVKPESNYRVKTFFFDKSGKLNTLYSAVSAEKTEIEG